MIRLVSFLFFSFALILVACQRAERPAELPAAAKAFVAGYSTGILSKAGPVRVRFTQGPISPEAAGNAADPDLLTFSPAASGSLYWEDDRTLRFDPDEYFAPGTAYRAELALGQLFEEVPQEARRVVFEFHTRDQHLDLQFSGLYPADEGSPGRQEYRGTLFTADVAETASVEEVLQAVQNGEDLEISWTHSTDGLEHGFLVNGVQRSAQPGQLLIRWNGRPVGATDSGEKTVDLPALGSFEVLQARSLQNPEQAILLQFSDPLDSEQDLTGLLRIEGYGGELRYLIEGNEVYIYPGEKLSGTYEIIAAPGIRDATGNRLRERSSWDVNLTMPFPQVRVAGQGVILPESKGLIFPFEAIGLEAVLVEVFKIYDNNILQFLQNNELGGDNELYRVGRIVLQEKIDLRLLNPNAEASRWGRYALDLAQLFQQDPEAIYQIRIGFKPSYARYACDNDYTGQAESSLEVQTSPDGELESLLDSWYGFDGYYQGYRWEDREDPCKPAYYNYERFVRRNLLASNLGVIAKGNDRNAFVATVSDLRTTLPVTGAKLEFYDYFQQLIGEGETGGDGTFSTRLDKKPFVVVAQKGGQKGYLRLSDGGALSLSRFDVEGVSPQQGLKGFLYAERGVWRPGDSVHLHFILEDEQGSLPNSYPVVFELYNPRGQLVERRGVSQHTSRIYALPFATSADAPTGRWRAEVKVGGATFSKNLTIETIQPNRLETTLEFEERPIRWAGEKVPVALSARWLHGAPASGLKAVVEGRVSSRTTSFPAFGDYVFDDPTRRMAAPARKIFDGVLNSAGKAAFTAELVRRTPLPSGKLDARFRTRVFEPGGAFSTSQDRIEISPFRAYAGIALPTNEYGQKRLSMGEESQLELVVLDESGEPLPDRRLSAEVYRMEWRWWWERNNENISNFNYSRNLEEQLTTQLRTGNNGKTDWTLTLDQWGRYLVRVCDTEGGHCAADFVYVGYPYGAEADGSRQDAALLAFTARKASYQVGERVELLIPAEEESRAFVSLETGSEVLSSQWIDLVPGQNTFSFTAEQAMSPNVYAHVTLVQAHGQRRNDRPIRMYGVLPIVVEDPATLLEPTISTPEEIRPEATFSVAVSEQNGKPMAYTLAVVDEGLLGITRFSTPDPHAAFFAREALGVRTWDVYDQVLGAYGGQLDRILSVGGGDGERVEPEQQEANRFEPVVLHLGPFELERGQTARHELTMPNYVGQVRTMVVAAGAHAYGSAQKAVAVRQPVMVLATLPRVLGPGEEVRIPVNVFVQQDRIRQVEVRVRETSGLARLSGATRKTVSFEKPGSQVVYFDAVLTENIGQARFEIEASSGAENASQTIAVEVRNPNPVATNIEAETLEPGARWSTVVQPLGMPGTREGYLEVSSIPSMNLGQRLPYLLQYPYGCVEQTVSAGFPQLFAGRLMDLTAEEEKRMQAHVQATIKRLMLFQTAKGGLAYWPGQNTPDHWSTNYGGHFLLEAREQGYTIPQGLLQNWLDFQQQTARLWSPDDRPPEYGFNYRQEEELIQAYRLYTLALARQPDLASMNRLRERAGLHFLARWRLAAAYALVGRTEAARDLTDGLTTRVDPYGRYSYTYGSSLRDQAMILETRVLLDEKDAAADLGRRIAERLGQNRWYSTQTTAYCLLAVAKLLGEGGAGSPIRFTYSIGQEAAATTGTNSSVKLIDLTEDQLNKSTELSIENKGEALLFVRLIQRGQPVTGAERAESQGLEVAVDYLDLNGQALSPADLPQGTDFVARVRVTHTGQQPYAFGDLALDQIFPSGWEILNTRMDGMNRFQNSAADYRDIRDDRVYTFFDLAPGRSATYYVQLNAAYQGRYYLPSVGCAAMYDQGIRGSTSGRWVRVGSPPGI